MGDTAGHTACGQDWAGAERQGGTFGSASVMPAPGLALPGGAGGPGRERERQKGLSLRGWAGEGECVSVSCRCELCVCILLCICVVGVSLHVCRVYICVLYVSLCVYACVCDAPVCVCGCVHMHTCVCGNFEELNPLLRCVCCPETTGSLSTPSSPPHPPYPPVPCPQAFLALGPHSKSDLFSPSPSTSGLPTSLLPGFTPLPSATRGSCENLNLSGTPHPLPLGLLVFVLPATPSLGLSPELPGDVSPARARLRRPCPHTTPHMLSAWR